MAETKVVHRRLLDTIIAIQQHEFIDDSILEMFQRPGKHDGIYEDGFGKLAFFEKGVDIWIPLNRPTGWNDVISHGEIDFGDVPAVVTLQTFPERNGSIDIWKTKFHANSGIVELLFP